MTPGQRIARRLNCKRGMRMSETRMSDVLVKKAFTELSDDADKRTVISALAESLAESKANRSW